jgi:hypothetical protein
VQCGLQPSCMPAGCMLLARPLCASCMRLTVYIAFPQAVGFDLTLRPAGSRSSFAHSCNSLVKCALTLTVNTKSVCSLNSSTFRILPGLEELPLSFPVQCCKRQNSNPGIQPNQCMIVLEFVWCRSTALRHFCSSQFQSLTTLMGWPSC